MKLQMAFPLLICTCFLKNQVWWTGFLQATQAVKIQFIKLNFSKLIHIAKIKCKYIDSGGMSISNRNFAFEILEEFLKTSWWILKWYGITFELQSKIWYGGCKTDFMINLFLTGAICNPVILISHITNIKMEKLGFTNVFLFIECNFN